MIDTESGCAGPKWITEPGTALFIRKDNKPLTEIHLEALWMFNDTIVDLYGESPTLAKNMMTRTQWDRFWKEYKTNQINSFLQYPLGWDRSDEIRAWKTDPNPLDV